MKAERGLEAPRALFNISKSTWAATFLPGLYPNLEELGDYMGLSLNGEEVQQNLALLPVAANVSVWTRPWFSR